MKVLVVGYGFAGSSLSYFLNQKGIQVEIISCKQFDQSSSSKVSAGIMLPFSGKRKTLSYNVSTALPFALDYYRKIQNNSGLKILSDLPVRQLLTEAMDYNDWFAKSNELESGIFIDQIHLSEVSKKLRTHIGYLQFNHANAVNSAELLKAHRMVSSSTIIHQELFEIEKLIIKDNTVNYNKHEYDLLIFCEGFRSIFNPIWNSLPFRPVKGEIIDIYAPGLQLDFILNGSLYMIPLGQDKYKVGATYNWKDVDELPGKDGLQYLSSELEKMISIEYDIIGHFAGVRPAIQDRRPVIGLHPRLKSVGIFNGLGTKGAMLSPYYGKMMADHIIEDSPIDFEVSIDRFSNLL